MEVTEVTRATEPGPCAADGQSVVLEIVRGRAESELGPDVALELTVWSRRLECQRFGR